MICEKTDAKLQDGNGRRLLRIAHPILATAVLKESCGLSGRQVVPDGSESELREADLASANERAWKDV